MTHKSKTPKKKRRGPSDREKLEEARALQASIPTSPAEEPDGPDEETPGWPAPGVLYEIRKTLSELPASAVPEDPAIPSSPSAEVHGYTEGQNRQKDGVQPSQNAKRIEPVTNAAAGLAAANQPPALLLHAAKPVLLSETRPHPRNYRSHPEDQREHLRNSLAEFGQYRNVVLARDGTILCGHGVAQSAADAGATEIMAVRLDLDPEEPRALKLMAADNEVTRMAVDDDRLLGELLTLVRDSDETSLLGTGYDDSALAALLQDVADAAPATGGEDPGPDEIPAAAVSQPGEVYALGPHRILCGDATDGVAVEALFAGQKASLVWTDPPYGVDVAGGTKDPRQAAYRSGDTLENDGDEEVAEETARDALKLAFLHAEPGAVLYQAAPSRLLPAALRAFVGGGFSFRHELVWVKDALVMGRADYHYRHEPILYGWKEGAAHRALEDRAQDSVLEFPRPKRSEEHPTMKPVELVERLVKNSSRVGEVVYDPFTGSGSTLIACARLNRRFLGCEIDPRYVDVIRRRYTKWAKTNGLDAGTGGLE